MAPGGMRRPAAWVMLAGAFGVLAAAILLARATVDADRQIQDLDPSSDRMEATMLRFVWGAAIGSTALLVFLLGALTLGLSAGRASRRGAGPAQPDARVLASVAAFIVAVALVWTVLAPAGPVQYAAALMDGGGSPLATQVTEFNGTLTGTAFSPTPPQNVHPVKLPTNRGSVTIRFGSGGAGVAANAVATVEAQQLDGTWTQVARLKGADETVQVPEADYPGDLRVRVTLDAGGVGQTQYRGAVAFTPAR